MTIPEANDADRQEQQEPVVPPAAELADEVEPPPFYIPEADVLEQQTVVPDEEDLRG